MGKLIIMKNPLFVTTSFVKLLLMVTLTPLMIFQLIWWPRHFSSPSLMILHLVDTHHWILPFGVISRGWFFTQRSFSFVVLVPYGEFLSIRSFIYMVTLPHQCRKVHFEHCDIPLLPTSLIQNIITFLLQRNDVCYILQAPLLVRNLLHRCA